MGDDCHIIFRKSLVFIRCKELLFRFSLSPFVNLERKAGSSRGKERKICEGGYQMSKSSVLQNRFRTS